MQDPLFQFAPEQSFDLGQFNNFMNNSAPSGAGAASPSGEKIEGNPQKDNQAVMDGETAQVYEKAVEMIEQSNEEVEPSSLASRIQEIQKFYNDRPAPICGKQLYNRLLTLASRLNKEGRYSHANSICKALE